MLKLYLDTSVYGGYFDEEFKDETKQLFDKIDAGEYQIITSSINEEELRLAPQEVKELYQSVKNSIQINIENDERVDSLAEQYIKAGVVGATSFADCTHIAVATIYNADVLVSWNFKHIVNIMRIVGYNTVNEQSGYKKIEIRSPKEILSI